MEQKDIYELPGKAHFFLFITMLMKENQAYFHKERNNLIYLKPYPSNFFIIGKDNEKENFLGVPQKMIPWFLEIHWDRVTIDNKNGYIYLHTTGEEENDLILALKARKKRLSIFGKSEDYETEASINFKIFNYTKSNSTNEKHKEIQISIPNYLTLPLRFSDNPFEGYYYETGNENDDEFEHIELEKFD